MNNEEPKNKEPNKPIPAQELTEKELEGINGGVLFLKENKAVVG